jgi:hypothetical protein
MGIMLSHVFFFIKITTLLGGFAKGDSAKGEICEVELPVT